MFENKQLLLCEKQTILQRTFQRTFQRTHIIKHFNGKKIDNKNILTTHRKHS